MSEDSVKADPKHYKVEFENERVRVLRVHYGAGEKSVMHGHPDLVAVFLTDHDVKFSYRGHKAEEAHAKAGQVHWFPAVEHLPENLDNKPLELILIELKR